jgi:hypothetical protein
MPFSSVVRVPSDDTATIETGPLALEPPCWPSVPIIRAPNGPAIPNVVSPPTIGPEGIGTVVCPFASISIPETPSPPNATRSGSNEGRVGVGVAVSPTVPLGDGGEVVAVPQAARTAALTIIRAVRWIRIEWFPSFLASVCACGTTTPSLELRD